MAVGELAGLDAVTVDAMGTLVRLVDPCPRLAELAGVSELAAREGFAAEVAYYVPRSLEGRDAASLAVLRAACTDVFNAAAGATLTPEQFVGAIGFEPVPGAVETLRRLRAHGLELCVVSNWDCALEGHLRALGIDLPVVTSAEAAAAKPDPALFHAALGRLGVRAERALHVGDSPADEEGARAAGMRFAPAPLEPLL